MKQLFPLLLIGLGTTFSASAQLHPKKIKHQNITLSSAEGDKKFMTINDLSPKIRTKNERWYHWYHPHALHITAGDFSGRLLDGEYKYYYSNGDLKEKGEFKKGLKSGEWKSWYENGQLREVSDWKKGRKHGKYCSYDEQGQMMINGRFKKDSYVGLEISSWKKFVEFLTFKKLREQNKARKNERASQTER